MMRWAISLFVIFQFVLCGCGYLDQSPKKSEKLDHLRGEFQFTVHQELETVTSLTRFSLTANGTGVSLRGFQFYLDGKLVVPDSTEMNGVFYEMEMPLADFFREHTIELRAGSDSFSVKFAAESFSMEAGFLDADRQKDLEFTVKGVPADESVLVSMVDTSFDNNDLIHKFPVNNGRVVIPAAELLNLSPGPVSAEISYEKKIQATSLGLRRATIVIRQRMSGEFQLQ